MKTQRKILIVVFYIILIALAFFSVQYMDYVNQKSQQSADNNDGTEKITEESETELTEKPLAEEETDLSALPYPTVFKGTDGGAEITITVNADGTFAGTYEEPDTDDVTSLYPKGSEKYAEFSGKFTELYSENGLTAYSVESVKTERSEDTSEVRNGVLYEFILPEIFDSGSEWILETDQNGRNALIHADTGIILQEAG